MALLLSHWTGCLSLNLETLFDLIDLILVFDRLIDFLQSRLEVERKQLEKHVIIY